MMQADFLCLDMGSPELAEVQGVVLDPSCSGSGTSHSRMDHLLPSKGYADAEQEAARLQSLAAFQVHAAAIIVAASQSCAHGSYKIFGLHVVI